METTLSKDVQEKLDIINRDSLKDKYGISRETFYNNPQWEENNSQQGCREFKRLQAYRCN